jgi:hypothetical protein
MMGVSIGHSRAESWDGPQYANGSKREARSEYEREIQHAGFQNPHDDPPCAFEVTTIP